MTFDAIGRLVMTETLRRETSSTGIFYRLRVNDHQGRPVGLFLETV